MTKKKQQANKREIQANSMQIKYEHICRKLGIKSVVAMFGLKEVLWAMNRYVLEQREIARHLKEKAELERKLAKLEAKMP